MKKEIKVGLIGFGNAGQIFHSPIITSVSGLNLYKIRETKEENMEIAKRSYPTATIVPHSNDIIFDPDIDLVVIATPNKAHFPLAKQALTVGKNVVVDKPFTITSAEADELIVLHNRQGKLLSVFHNRRFDSVARTTKKVVESGLLGKIVEVELHYDRFRNYFKQNAWREEDELGSGILYDLGAHMIDEVQSLFGSPDEVYADLRIQREGGKAVDNFEVVLNYSNLKVTLKAGMLVREPGPTCIIYGTEGSYLKYGGDVQEEALKAGMAPHKMSNWGIEPEITWGKINTTHKGIHIVGKVESEPGDYRLFYQNIYKVLIGEEQLIVKPEQARNTIKIIETCIESNNEKKFVRFLN